MIRSRFHSVLLEEDSCKGCTICVTGCPVQAIRVRDGKARILQEKCIDCGECIRRCPNHAKKAAPDNFAAFRLQIQEGSAPRNRIVLPAPSLYGQVGDGYSIGEIHRALLSLGFTAVFPVAAATAGITAATAFLLAKTGEDALPRPVISASCPTVIKFIRTRFPTLLKNVSPVIPPVNLAAKLAYKTLCASAGTEISRKDTGLYFLSPCPGKITETLSPMDGDVPVVDGVFSLKDIHLPLLAALRELRKSAALPPDQSFADSGQVFREEIAWGRAGGEAEAAAAMHNCKRIAVDGIARCEKILEAVEDGKLDGVDFLELTACPGGCVGGVLTIENPSIAEFRLRAKEEAERNTPEKTGAEQFAQERPMRQTEIEARPALLLDPDFKKAAAMMEQIEEIAAGLPGLDCGCCGAPNCRALAEDIVRGNAEQTDCIVILKEQYRSLLENGG